MESESRKNLHRNNFAEWVMVVLLLWPAWLASTTWNRVQRFVPFVTSWFNKSK